MSSYIYFYIKSNDQFILVNYFSRSHRIYGYASRFAEDEKIKVLRESSLETIFNNISEDLEGIKSDIKKTEKLKDSIALMNNSIAEKIETIDHLQEVVNNLEYDLDEVLFAQNFFIILHNIFIYNEGNCSMYIGIETPLESLKELDK